MCLCHIGDPPASAFVGFCNELMEKDPQCAGKKKAFSARNIVYSVFVVKKKKNHRLCSILLHLLHGGNEYTFGTYYLI